MNRPRAFPSAGDITLKAATTALTEALFEWLSAPERGHLRSWVLCLPLLVFLGIFFLLPLAYLLRTALHNPSLSDAWPQFVETLEQDAELVPGEGVFRIMALELKRLPGDDESVFRNALKPLSQQDWSLWRLFESTANALPDNEVPSMKAWFIDFDKRWGEDSTWLVIRRVAAPFGVFYLVNAVDSELSPNGSVHSKPPERRQYRTAIGSTIYLSLGVTLLTLILGYPLAYWLATLPKHQSRIFLWIVFASMALGAVVKGLAWLIILERQGPLNHLLMTMGLLDEPMGLSGERFGMLLATVYALLPFMVIPIYRSMRGRSLDYLHTAVSLGAPPIRAVRTAYLPHTLPGAGIGCLCVLVLSAGYYVIPALLAGPEHRPVSVLTYEFLTNISNDGMTAAFASLLLAMVLGLLALWRYLQREYPEEHEADAN